MSEARTDLDRVPRELHSLQTALELIQEDAKDDTKPFPAIIQRHVSEIVTNCNSVVVEIQTCIKKYRDGKVKNKAAWALNGQGDMQKLRSSLEAHKSALELALDMLTLSATKDIKAETAEIRKDTAAIKDDTAQILEEITWLQERLPATAAASNILSCKGFLRTWQLIQNRRSMSMGISVTAQAQRPCHSSMRERGVRTPEISLIFLSRSPRGKGHSRSAKAPTEYPYMAKA